MNIDRIPGRPAFKLEPAELLFPNGGGLNASKNAKLQRIKEEEAAKAAKSKGK
jgi:hypothetical protein